MVGRCFVNEEVNENQKADIRKKVCRDLDIVGKHEGNEYCILHFPSKNKDGKQFEQIINERVKEVNTKAVEIEKFQNKQEHQFSELSYDFRFVWFPNRVDFKNQEFKVSTDFSNAVFTDHTLFSEGTFIGSANFSGAAFASFASFSDATFEGSAKFDNAIFTFIGSFHDAAFTQDVSFRETIFTSSANFVRVAFVGSTFFNNATFTQPSSFKDATFAGYTSFNETVFFRVAFVDAMFEEHSRTLFRDTNFCESALFKNAIVEGHLSFLGSNESPIFLDEKFVKKEKLKIAKKLDDLQEGLSEEALITRYVRDEYKKTHLVLDGAEPVRHGRITFHTTRLLPNWFINTDSRKLIFTDARWENHIGTKQDVKSEIENLIERKIDNPHKLLVIAARHLAANAENDRNYEDASHFRKMAFEIERFERKENRKRWWNDFLNIGEVRVSLAEFFFTFPEASKKVWILLKSFPIGILQFFYRWLSGFGEKWFQAFCWLFGIWIVFGFYYYFFGTFGPSTLGRSTNLINSLGYSLQVMTLQRPEPKPIGATRFFYGLEITFTAVQTALLILAIRRKFIR